MKKIVNRNEIKVINTCKRCNEDKKVDKFGLCEMCEMEIDYEYSNLYRIKTMDH